MSQRERRDENLARGRASSTARSLGADVDEAFDFVVVGSGAAGAVAAHTLAELGFSVAIVEEGPWVKTRDFGPNVVSTRSAAHARRGDAGDRRAQLHPAHPGALRRRQHRHELGHRVAHCRRTCADWATRFGLAGRARRRSRSSRTSTRSRASSTSHAVHDDVARRQQPPLPRGAERRGVERARRCTATSATARARGAACTAARRRAKQGMNVSYVPWALALGARIFCSCRVERVRVEGGRATAVSRDPRRPGRSHVRARAARRARRGEHHPDAEHPASQRACARARSASTSRRTRASASAASSTGRST